MDSMMLTPEEAERRRLQTLAERAESQSLQMRAAGEPEPTTKEFKNHGDSVRITYESNGRFSIPPVLYFKNYRAQHVADLAVSREEDIIETMINILKGLCTEPGIKVEDMLMEEFYETLVNIKAQFQGPMHKHRWNHSCQNDLEEEERQLSTTEIDLRTLGTKSIEDAEEQLREYHKKQFESMTDEEFQEYLQHKYGQQVTSTREAEVAKIYIKEPVHIIVGEDDFEFKFPRIGDVARGLRTAFDRYNKKVRRLKSKGAIPGMSPEETKEFRNEEIENYDKERQKTAILASRAMSLHKKNGAELTVDQKIYEFSNMPVNVVEGLSKFFDSVDFGIVDERELLCDLCQKTEKRVLHQQFQPLEFLPSESGNDASTAGKQGVVARTFIYM